MWAKTTENDIDMPGIHFDQVWDVSYINFVFQVLMVLGGPGRMDI